MQAEMSKNIAVIRAKEIKKALIDKGITQVDIAKELGVTRDAVCKVINSTTTSKRIARKIEEITGVAL